MSDKGASSCSHLKYLGMTMCISDNAIISEPTILTCISINFLQHIDSNKGSALKHQMHTKSRLLKILHPFTGRQEMEESDVIGQEVGHITEMLHHHDLAIMSQRPDLLLEEMNPLISFPYFMQRKNIKNDVYRIS